MFKMWQSGNGLLRPLKVGGRPRCRSSPSLSLPAPPASPARPATHWTSEVSAILHLCISAMSLSCWWSFILKDVISCRQSLYRSGSILRLFLWAAFSFSISAFNSKYMQKDAWDLMYNNFQSRHDPLTFYFKFQILLNKYSICRNQFYSTYFTYKSLPSLNLRKSSHV